MCKKEIPNWVAEMDPRERLCTAEDKISKIQHNIKFLIYGCEICNVILSNTFFERVDNSPYKRTFLVTADTVYHSLITQLHAIWDPPGRERISIPTIALLIDSKDVKYFLELEVAAKHFGIEKTRELLINKETRNKTSYITYTPNDQNKYKKLEANKKIDMECAQDSITSWSKKLKLLLNSISSELNSDAFKNISRFRNEYLAHYLATVNFLHPVFRYEDVAKLIDTSATISNELRSTVLLREVNEIDEKKTRNDTRTEIENFWNSIRFDGE